MKRLLIVTAALFAAVAGGIAYAAIPGEGGLISGCYKKNVGNLRVIDVATDACHPSEEPISWNAQGVQGEKGEPGEKGAQGDTGPQGPAGPPGESERLGTGPGLERVDLGLPPPLGGELLQITPAYRLPQQCGAGSVPQRAGVGSGWSCASPGSVGLPLAYHDGGSGGVRLSAHNLTEVAAVSVPAGSYVVSGMGYLFNGDIFGDQPGTCELSSGGRSSANLEEGDENDAGIQTAIFVMGVATFDEASRIVLSCSTYDGSAVGELTAIRVGGIN